MAGLSGERSGLQVDFGIGIIYIYKGVCRAMGLDEREGERTGRRRRGTSLHRATGPLLDLKSRSGEKCAYVFK